MRRILIVLLCISMLGSFAGCRAKTSSEIDTGNTIAQDETAITEEYIPIDATVSDVGSDKFEGEFIEIKPQCPPSYGISFWLPTGWTYSGMQSDDDPTSDLVVSIRPEVPGTEGAITLQHIKGFAVCGTGLEQKDIVFNGHPAWQGFYDGQSLWSHIILKDPKDCVIINDAENWYEEYEEEINQVLSTVEFVYYETNTPAAESAEIIIDSASFDIDGDGIIEDCKIADGPTSGLFTVVITASVNGTVKYKNTFNFAWGELSFGEKDGAPCIIRERSQDQEPKTEYLPLSVQEGRIVIGGLDPTYEGYWGDSKWNYGLEEKTETDSDAQSPDAFSSVSIDEPYIPPSIADLSITGYDGFCDVLSAKLIDGSKNSNLSPISVYLALAMVTEGAQDETQTAMLALLGCTSLEELRSICGEMLEQLSVDAEDSTLAIADSIWMADRNGTLKFNDDYLKVLGETYRSEANAVDFGKEETSKQIADWITEHTRGKIKISEDAMKFDPETIAVLINTIYLKDAWRDAFYEGATEKGTFYTPDGEMTVDYMKRKDDGVMIYQGDGYMRYSLPLLRVGRMTFILPDEGMTLADILGTPEQMHMLLHGVTGKEIRANVSVKLPKFKFQDRFDLNDTLEALGIGIAFSDIADFSGMGDFDAKISNVFQESFIGVDEKGVEAAAYTLIAMDEGYMEPEELPEIDFHLTRPFLFAIESYDGTVLFIGTITAPVIEE